MRTDLQAAGLIFPLSKEGGVLPPSLPPAVPHALQAGSVSPGRPATRMNVHTVGLPEAGGFVTSCVCAGAVLAGVVSNRVVPGGTFYAFDLPHRLH